ncbi:MAG: dihydropteroate synthase, partial [Actinomycetota bacterium]
GFDETVAHALELVEEGADVLDVGAVKAGPGEEVSSEEERRRLVPIVGELASSVKIPISVETTRADVARAALAEGAAMVNDVTALSDEQLAEVCAEHDAALILMHNGGQLRGRPRNPRYGDVVAEVAAELRSLAVLAQTEGVAPDAIVIDPGLDFGKTTFHSLEIVRRLDELCALGYPLLLAPSRKDVVGETLGLPPSERLEGTLAIVALAAAAGAALVRVHDVAPTVRVVHTVESVLGRRAPVAPVRGLWE